MESRTSLQDLRRKIYIKAKAEPARRFWGLYVHVCKGEVLRASYQMSKGNGGASGLDGVTFEDIEAAGVEDFLEQIRDELVSQRYSPTRNRKVEIPKGNGKTRTLSIPTIRDRVVQGALRLILEPIFEADFYPGSYGYRPRRSAHDAIERVTTAIAEGKTRVIDLDLRSFFDGVRHHRLLEKVAARVQDAQILRLLKLILKAGGSVGIPQGGSLSPLLSNLYLNEVDAMLERAQRTTQEGRWTYMTYARYADDLVVLLDPKHPRAEWLRRSVWKRLREELVSLDVEINEEKTREVDLAQGGSFGFLGFDFRRILSRNGRWRPYCQPQMKKRTELIGKLREIFRRFCSQPVQRIIDQINPILRGWVLYFRVGSSRNTFSYIRWWVEKKIRRHLRKAKNRRGFGWEKWSSRWLHDTLGVFDAYRLVRYHAGKATPAR
jgi:RNA-directed DNA polymerase